MKTWETVNASKPTTKVQFETIEEEQLKAQRAHYKREVVLSSAVKKEVHDGELPKDLFGVAINLDLIEQ